MKISKTKALILSSVVLLLCIGALVLASFALFSDNGDSKNNHLEAGTLSVELKRTNLVGFEMNEDGTYKKVTDTDEIDLKKNADPIFSIENAVPGIYQEATLEIKNTGTVAFDCSFSIVKVDKGPQSNGESDKLCEQLQITVTDAEGNALAAPFKLSEAGSKGKIALGDVLKGETFEFNVRVEFLNSDEPDTSAEGGSVSFDLTVFAEQQTVSE